MKHSLIRTVYLYLFSLVGLGFLIGGTIGFMNMGLRIFVFKQADQDEVIRDMQPPMYYQIEKVRELDDSDLSMDDKEAIKDWLSDYEAWKERRAESDSVTINRHQDAANNLAMILVGLPVYLYHWNIVKKDILKSKNPKI